MIELNFNRKIRYLCCFLLALSISIFSANFEIFPAIAVNPSTQPIATDEAKDPSILEQKGKLAYHLASYSEAIDFWQQAKQLYYQRRDLVSQARIMGNLALANYQLGDVTKAQTEIKQSRQLLESRLKTPNANSTLARVLNNQGIIELGIGKTESAIATWDNAIVRYQEAEDDLGVVRVRLNQAKALKTIGLYRRALDSFTEINEIWAKLPDSQLKISGLRSYGSILRLTGKIDESRSILEKSLKIAEHLKQTNTSQQSLLTIEEIETSLALGNTLVILGDLRDISYYQTALQIYERAVDLCLSDSSCFKTNLPLKLDLAKLNLFVKTESWKEGIALIETIENKIPKKAQNKDEIDLKLNFIDNSIELNQRRSVKDISLSPKIMTAVNSAIADSQKINYRKGESYSWGLKGQIQENSARWDLAYSSTNQALNIAQAIDAPEISYLWQWQLGRIDRARGNKESAIAHYEEGVTLIDALGQDIARIESPKKEQIEQTEQTEQIVSRRQTPDLDRSLQYSFRERVEPVYREAVALMLEVSPGKKVSQQNLIKARDTIESLQLAELNNFFQEDCLKGKSVAIDSVDTHAAAIYPIVLGDRLEVIVSFPNRDLFHYSVAISQAELEQTVANLRQTIVIRSRRTFYKPATKLYNLLIAPIVDELSKHEIETLVFVPDRALRNVPFAALYDGKHYSIEQYNLVLNPGLQLLDPRPLQETKLKTLAVGLSQQRGDFAALENVKLELATIQEKVKSEILLDEKFTAQSFQEKIAFSDYPIVHIATHGQFSSSRENTFLLAWDRQIDLDRLNQILQTRRANNNNSIELIILSACETATGDKNATLGLAGIAIQAGARSTVATLWSVDDRATAELMSVLYREIATRSINKAAAIRKAQLRLLNDPQYRHPFYWAAYTTIGNWL